MILVTVFMGLKMALCPTKFFTHPSQSWSQAKNTPKYPIFRQEKSHKIHWLMSSGYATRQSHATSSSQLIFKNLRIDNRNKCSPMSNDEYFRSHRYLSYEMTIRVFWVLARVLHAVGRTLFESLPAKLSDKLTECSTDGVGIELAPRRPLWSFHSSYSGANGAIRRSRWVNTRFDCSFVDFWIWVCYCLWPDSGW